MSVGECGDVGESTMMIADRIKEGNSVAATKGSRKVRLLDL